MGVPPFLTGSVEQLGPPRQQASPGKQDVSGGSSPTPRCWGRSGVTPVHLVHPGPLEGVCRRASHQHSWGAHPPIRGVEPPGHQPPSLFPCLGMWVPAGQAIGKSSSRAAEKEQDLKRGGPGRPGATRAAPLPSPPRPVLQVATDRPLRGEAPPRRPHRSPLTSCLPLLEGSPLLRASHRATAPLHSSVSPVGPWRGGWGAACPGPSARRAWGLHHWRPKTSVPRHRGTGIAT